VGDGEVVTATVTSVARVLPLYHEVSSCCWWLQDV